MKEKPYYKLKNEAKDIDDVLDNLIKARDNEQIGKSIGIVDGKQIGALDNVITSTNISLSPVLKEINSNDDVLELPHLLENGNMYRIINEDGLQIINEINILDTSLMDYFQDKEENPISTTHDYYCTFIFKRGKRVNEPYDLMINFKNEEERENYSSIKLLNPDIDISDFTIIHLLLFNDSENICALLSGY